MEKCGSREHVGWEMAGTRNEYRNNEETGKEHTQFVPAYCLL